MAGTEFRAFSGKLIDVSKLREGDVEITDIARSLAMQNRYGGHTNFPYSVAQHSVILAVASPMQAAAEGLIQSAYEYQMTAAAALLHDANETYIQDIMTPNKRRMTFLGMRLQDFEQIIQKVIFNKFGVPWEFMELIAAYDSRIFFNEAPVLLSGHQATSNANPIPGVRIAPWTWQEAEQQFLLTAKQLELINGHH